MNWARGRSNARPVRREEGSRGFTVDCFMPGMPVVVRPHGRLGVVTDVPTMARCNYGVRLDDGTTVYVDWFLIDHR